MANAGFGTPGNGDDIGQRVEVPLPIHVPFGDRQQMLKSDTGQEDHHADFTHDQSMREIGRGRVFGNRHFTQRRTDVRQAAKAADQTCRFPRSPTLKGRHTEPCQGLVGDRS